MKNFNFLKNNNCYVIAEAGLNHNGSIEIAKKLIDLASKSGANAVKFQKRTVDDLATKSVLNAKDDRFPEFGNTYKEIREFLEFDEAEYIELYEYAKTRNIDFIVTAFDIKAFNFLKSLGIKIIKLASHSLTNYNLLEKIASEKFPAILSTGMCDFNEIDKAVSIFKKNNSPLALLHCVSSYPTPIDDCNISMIDILKKRYGLVTGYSGHELGYLPTIAAVARGAQIIERHYTLDKLMVGFDHKISLEPDELVSMIKEIRTVEKIIGSGNKQILENEWITRKKYHVSMVSLKEIKEGDLLDETMVTYRNPGTGIPFKDSYKVMGRKAIKNIKANELISLDMFEK